jgi:outer membrane protein TolC
MSSWLPQVSWSASYQHYFQLPTAFSSVNGNLTPIKSGVYNYSLPQITASQNLFSPDVLFAQRIASLGIKSAEQNTITNKINLVADVNKAFYDILLTQEQIHVYMEDTARLNKNKEDAYHRYKSGVADKVDLKQATISLNNAMTQLRTANEQLDAKYAVLKMILGCPPGKPLRVTYDPAILLKELNIDTNSTLQVSKRPEFKQLLLARSMQMENARYYKMGFLPSVSAYYNYVQEFENNRFDHLFNNAYPYSSWGLQINVPIFSGLRRTENVHKANLQLQRVDYDLLNLELTIYAQYKQAMAAYKSNLFYFQRPFFRNRFFFPFSQ